MEYDSVPNLRRVRAAAKAAFPDLLAALLVPINLLAWANGELPIWIAHERKVRRCTKAIAKTVLPPRRTISIDRGTAACLRLPPPARSKGDAQRSTR